MLSCKATMSPVRRKAVIVATGLLLFVMITYKYSSVIPNTTSSGKLTQQKTAIFQTIIHHQDSTGRKTTQKGEISIINSPILQKNVKEETHANAAQVRKNTKSSKDPKTYFKKDCDHFVDWPSPSQKKGCHHLYILRDNSMSIVIYLKDSLDSVPLQTFLSILQFTKESRDVFISNVVLTYINNTQSLATHKADAAAMRDLVTSSVSITTTSADTEWSAKLAGVRLASSEQVFIVDDTLIMNRNFIKPLIHTLQDRHKTLISPHFDSFMSMRIYSIYKDKKMHPDSQIWQETNIGTFRVVANMTMSRHNIRNVQSLPVTVPTGGLNGEALAGRRSWLLSLISNMQTDEVSELSLLSYMCGEGVLINKCSVAVRTNNYFLVAPKTKDSDRLQHLYPFYDNNPNKKYINGCKDVKYYFSQVNRFSQLG